MQTRSFVGLDVHKATIAVSIAGDGRNGEVRFLGAISNTPDEIAKLAKRLSRHGMLDFCYEAGGIYRQLTLLGHNCMVVAPSMIPRKPGERIKTDRRGSQKLAILHRSGDLTAVWVPDVTHEAIRDLVRARLDASAHYLKARQQLVAFLLRQGRTYTDGKNWTGSSGIAAGWRARRSKSILIRSSSKITLRPYGQHSRGEVPEV